jgi:hypothetical protein
LDGERPAQLQYTAPTTDGDADVDVHTESADGTVRRTVQSSGDGGNRAERRAKAKRKR